MPNKQPRIEEKARLAEEKRLAKEAFDALPPAEKTRIRREKRIENKRIRDEALAAAEVNNNIDENNNVNEFIYSDDDISVHSISNISLTSLNTDDNLFDDDEIDELEMLLQNSRIKRNTTIL